MFTAASREALRERLVEHARSSPEITAAALVGSAAAGAEDAWSDIDLALRIAPGADQDQVAAAWTALLVEQCGAVHHLDVRSGSTLFRVFLLRDSLQIDLSFWQPDDFRPTGGPFLLLFGGAGEPAPSTAPTPEHLLGMAWLHALHVRSALARHRLWQASTMLDGLREQLVSLTCLRAGLPAHQGRGTDRLPPDLLDALAATRPPAVRADDLTRAFAAATALLLEQAAIEDPGLAARLREPLALLVRPQDPPPSATPMPSTLHTLRLRLRPFRPADAAWLHDLWAERDRRSRRLLDADGTPTVEDLRRDLVARVEAGGPQLLVAERTADGTAIGYCGLVVGQASRAEPELAFELFRWAHGQGYATEAARAVVDAADAAGTARLWSTVREWNAPSLRVLAKLGFVPSGRIDRDRERGDSVWLVRAAGGGSVSR
jgi:RimJ/RimL family protein N-acetyltransferase/predicted nucleotidyltransferase